MTNDSSDTPETLRRRRFLARVSLGLGALSVAAVSVPSLAYVFGPTLESEQERWRDVGAVNAFEVGTTVEVTFDSPEPSDWTGVSARMGAWLRRTSEADFVAFSINCTHLGCPVRWLPAAELFMCPCHGGVFYGDGRVAAGPPREPLKTLRVRITNGRVELSTRPIPIIG